MTCRACGEILQPQNRFCPACGAPQQATPLPSLDAAEPRWLEPGLAPRPQLPRHEEPPPRPGMMEPPAPRPSQQRIKLPPLSSPQAKATKKDTSKRSPLPLLVLGLMALLWGGLLLSNVVVKNSLSAGAMKLSPPMRPCLEAVLSLDKAVDWQGRLSKQAVTADWLRKDKSFEMVKDKCPSITVKDTKAGLFIEAPILLKDGTTCRIWAAPEKKVQTDCPPGAEPAPEKEKK